ncbi:YegP family protein [Neptunitalea lumnitzerae]|uniref:UPF0339 protein YegP n=1 Tax=Neptunitalea lumnitzerae TaxID=2965509 RepID=A0ABQ5MIA8_9FLAO|nr:hypothetical protein [Neptunitalea sp. Y10]GLB49156.1 UPF0339 protein YegP [Neptunitalea sp. Y10]
MFEVIQIDDTEYFQFILKTNNGNVLLFSMEYMSEEDAFTASRLCKQLSLSKTNFERKTASNGKFFFIIKDMFGKAIADSSYFSSEVGMQNVIDSIIQMFQKKTA